MWLCALQIFRQVRSGADFRAIPAGDAAEYRHYAAWHILTVLESGSGNGFDGLVRPYILLLGTCSFAGEASFEQSTSTRDLLQ